MAKNMGYYCDIGHYVSSDSKCLHPRIVFSKTAVYGANEMSEIQQIFDDYATKMRKSARILAFGMLVCGLTIGYAIGLIVGWLIGGW